MRNGRFLFLILVFVMIPSCKVQAINLDKQSWDIIVANVGDNQISILIPRGAIFSKTTDIIEGADDLDEEQEILLLFGYDYKSDRNSVPEFNIVVALEYAPGISPESNMLELKMAVADNYNRVMREYSSEQTSSVEDYTVVDIGDQKWVTEDTEHGAFYANVFLEDYYLTVSAILGQKIRKDPAWERQRLELFDDIVGQVNLRRAGAL